MKLYRKISELLMAIDNCQKVKNQEWELKHKDRLFQLTNEYLPNGGGYDHGTSIDLFRSTPEKLVFNTNFHHMNSDGYYTGWTDHTITVKASLFNDIDMTISGINKNDIKNEIYEAFYQSLRLDVK